MPSRHTVLLVSAQIQQKTSKKVTLVPHANAIAVAAMTETTLAVFNLLSDIEAERISFKETLLGHDSVVKTVISNNGFGPRVMKSMSSMVYKRSIERINGRGGKVQLYRCQE